MHAILISEANIPEIIQTSPECDTGETYDIDLFLRSPKKWYFVNGFVSSKGDVSWTVLPQYILDLIYDYDPVKIQHDWDIIVHKS